MNEHDIQGPPAEATRWPRRSRGWCGWNSPSVRHVDPKVLAMSEVGTCRHSCQTRKLLNSDYAAHEARHYARDIDSVR